jgi:hypothetical protein
MEESPFHRLADERKRRGPSRKRQLEPKETEDQPEEMEIHNVDDIA